MGLAVWPALPARSADEIADAVQPSTSSAYGLKGSAVDAEVIHAAAQYLVSRCDEDGKFLYRENFNPELKLKPKYNMLRHAGTIYALAMYEKEYPDEKTRDAIRRAVGFLRSKGLRPVPDFKEAVAVWSDPELTGSDNPLQAKLGGAGLAIVALISAERVVPRATTIKDCRALARFIVFMQKADGGFYSKYIPDRGGRDDSWVSLYYPGEAALGLLMLYEKDADKIWLRAAANALNYLATLRKGKAAVDADHWALIATGRLLPHLEKAKISASRKDILLHAGQICSSILNSKASYPPGIEEFGSFMDDGRTCPTAARLEGLLAALRYVPAGDRVPLAASIDESMPFLVRSQITKGPLTGAFPRAIRLLPETHKRYNKKFNQRATEIRIDYVQHAMSAMLMYNALLEGK